MIPWIAAFAIIWAILSIGPLPPRASAQPVGCPAVKKGLIQTCNTAKLRNDEYWDWDLFLVSDEETLGKIRCVEYVLHPTFPKPVRVVCEKGKAPQQGFDLRASGWGTFKVQIKVIFKDGTEQYFSHNLIFN